VDSQGWRFAFVETVLGMSVLDEIIRWGRPANVGIHHGDRMTWDA
jgi:hypothetical protein